MEHYTFDSGRVMPAPDLPVDLRAALDKLMRGRPPLRLFTTVGRDPRLLAKLLNGGLLGPGNLTVRHREIVIHRVTATCGADYEFGVHAAYFASRAGLDDDALAALATPHVAAGPWSPAEAALIELCDSLDATCTIDDDLWDVLTQHFTDEAVIEALMLAGYYRMVSYLCNGLEIPLEPGTAPIAAHRP